MQRSTLVWLALVVLLLGGIVWWQNRRESSHAQEQDVPLFEGLDSASVSAVRIEVVERDVQLRAVRDSNDRWQLVDPVEVPAATELFDYLVKTALARRGTLVPDSEGDAQSLGFEPPRAILELESTSAGSTSKQRIEIGALDLDGQRIYVRARGQILRTTRDLDTTLARPLDDFKSRLALELDTRHVIEVHRTGRATLSAGAVARELAFDALAEDGRWRATSPVQAALDPVALNLWVQGSTRLEIKRFIQDGAAAPADYGLDPPEFSVELVTAQDPRAKLHFGRPGHTPGARWFARLADRASVWEVDENAVHLLAAPIEDLLDHRLVRRRAEAIDKVTLRTNERELVLARTGKLWQVSEKRGPSDRFTDARPAEPARVADLLGRLEAFEFAGFMFDEPFTPAPGGELISIESGTEAQGGTIGARVTSASGTAAHQFQRPGESVVALVDPSLIEIVHTPLEELLSLHLLDVVELEQAALRISGLGSERRYVRGPKGVWSAPDLALRAGELDQVLDPLLFPRAEDHPPADAQTPLVDPITIEFTSKAGALTTYTLGLAAGTDGEAAQVVEIDVGGRRAVLANKDRGLHAKLSALLKAPPR